MRQRILGSTDIRLSEVSLGTWGLATDAYGTCERKRFEEVVGAALDAGVSTIDMAPMWGESEAVVAGCVGTKRDDVQYITRVGITSKGKDIAERFLGAELEVSCHQSLRRLMTDRIDLVLLHNPPEHILRREDWRESFTRLRAAGKLLGWGVSVGSVSAARLAIAAGAQAICLPYNLLNRDGLHDISAEISVAHCGVLARSPLAYGLLSGTWPKAEGLEPTDHRKSRWTDEGLNQRVARVEALRFLVKDEIKDLASAAIRFVLANTMVTSAIVGARTPAQVESAATCGVGPPYLSDGDLRGIPQVLSFLGI